MVKRAVLYARISIAAEESVSVERQLRLGHKYAEAREWQVVDEFIDEGVSATKNKPEERPGWKALLASEDPFDAVVIWKVDRLARRVIDFLNADAYLQTRAAAIVCVEQNIDMTTSEGRAFAQMLAVFGELEGAAISDRMRSARAHLIQVGRATGGLQPYGWTSIPNPNGPGRVVAKDPDRIKWVRGMATRALRGESTNSIARWLDASQAPLPRSARRAEGDGWAYETVHRLLANPILAGQVLFNPGAGARSHAREVLRDEKGVPLVRADLAIISVVQRDRLLKLLESKRHRASVAREFRQATSPILSGMVYCGGCNWDRPMRRGTSGGRAVVRCPNCFQVMTTAVLAAYLERRLLQERGALPMFKRAYAASENPSAAFRLERIEHDLRNAAIALIEDSADVQAIGARMKEMKQTRAKARRQAGSNPCMVLIPAGFTVEQIWRRCATDDQRREVLAGQIERLTLQRGNRGGRYIDRSRVELIWNTDLQAVVPDGVDKNPTYETLREAIEWVSILEAAEMTGLSIDAVRRAVVIGDIEQRKAHRVHPSVSVRSLLAYAARTQATATDPFYDDRHDWISFREAAALTGINRGRLRKAVAEGLIEQRRALSSSPSLSRRSVSEYADLSSTTTD